MLEQKKKEFKEHQKKLFAYGYADVIMSYDSATVMPEGCARGLSAAVEVLSEEEYRLRTDERFIALARELDGNRNELDPVTAREAAKTIEDYERTSRIPMDEYVAFSVAQSESDNAWRAAKNTNDYELFRPYLERMVDFAKRFAVYKYPDKAPYEGALYDSDKSLDTAMLDGFFALLRTELAPLIKEVTKKAHDADACVANKSYPIIAQRELSNYIMEVMGLDRSRSSIGETEHPFTTGTSMFDVRITTHYHEHDLLSSMYSVLHESGHALYDMNVDESLFMSPLAQGESASVHEGQARFYENIIGRSPEFVSFMMPELKQLFPAQLKGVDENAFCRAANASRPSLIRTEADELTYSMHVMIRYELEKLLFKGEIKTRELPGAWDDMYMEYLGVKASDAACGVLQDMHWAEGMFGYFPSYSVGSAYGAQLVHAMQQDIDVFALAAKGELAPITAWLRERIFRHGAMKEPKEMLSSAFGGEFDPVFYTDYLKKKFSGLYL